MSAKKCPICGKLLLVPSNLAQPLPSPFCSERCRNVDLARWFGEGYHVPVESDRVVNDALGESEAADELE